MNYWKSKFVQSLFLTTILIIRPSLHLFDYQIQDIPAFSTADFGPDWHCWYEDYTHLGTNYFRLKASTSNLTVEGLQWHTTYQIKYIKCDPNFLTS